MMKSISIESIDMNIIDSKSPVMALTKAIIENIEVNANKEMNLVVLKSSKTKLSASSKFNDPYFDKDRSEKYLRTNGKGRKKRRMK